MEPPAAQVDDAHLAGLARVLGEPGPAVLAIAPVTEELTEELVALLVARVLAGVGRARRSQHRTLATPGQSRCGVVCSL